MECSYCKKPCRGEIAFELLENVKGEGPVKKRACFPCIQELGERVMRPPRPEVVGRCPDCNEPVPRGFRTCAGSGSHPSVNP